MAERRTGTVRTTLLGWNGSAGRRREICVTSPRFHSIPGMGGEVPWAGAHGYGYVSATRFKSAESAKKMSMVLHAW